MTDTISFDEMEQQLEDSSSAKSLVACGAHQAVPVEHFNPSQVKQLMKADLDYFAGICLPTVCTAPFTPLHHEMWRDLTTAVIQDDWDGVVRIAIGIPRGHAKTQLLKLLIVYIVLFTNLSFIMVVCNTATLAQNLLDDCMDMLQSDNLLALFGDFRADIEKDNAELKVFNYNNRPVILRPMGVGGKLRGSNIKNARPEIIICDDMQSREEALSPEVAKKQLEWFTATLYKARSYNRCAIFYIGNMYPDVEIRGRDSKIYGCILRNLQLNPDWKSWIGAAILRDGTALWEAVISLKDLLADLRQDQQLGQPEIFFSELMNDPKAQGGQYLDTTLIPDYEYSDGLDLVIGKFLVIDPSLGKKTSDDQIVALCYVYDHKGPVVREIRNIQKSAPETVKEVLLWALKEKVPLICAESVAYQATLIQWFQHYLDELQCYAIDVVGVTPKGRSKPSRILASYKSITAGTIILHPSIRPIYYSQALTYSPTSTKPVDDILDVVAYSEHIFVTHSSEYILPIDHMQPDTATTPELPYEDDGTEMSYSESLSI